jgi:hypothetical protein
MPKRVLDFDAMWGSDKLAACAPWAQAEYAWLYGLADASGCFELTNLRVIWGRVAAIRGNLTIERLEQVFAEFQDKGLLFVWEHEGKRYAHWTGSDVPGRLPPPSWRMRLERFAPPVPKQQLAEYMARFARGRAALAGVGFHGEAQREESNRKENLKFKISDLREEGRVAGRTRDSQRSEGPMPSENRGEDLTFENSDLREEREHARRVANSRHCEQRELFSDRREDCGDRTSHLSESRGDAKRFGNSEVGEKRAVDAARELDGMAHRDADIAERSGLKGRVEEGQAQDLGLDRNLNGNLEAGREGPGDAAACSGGANREREINRTDFYRLNSFSNSKAMSAKELAVARELRVGQGPVCGPGRVRPEVLERVRRREAARAGSRAP